LAQHRWRLQADDVVLMHKDGMISGLPFPFGAKAGAWPLIADHWPQALADEEYVRPDGQRIRYIVPQHYDERGRRTIGGVVLLNRKDAGGVDIAQIHPSEALMALIAEGDAQDDRLTSSAFS
jgi:hypothetical protein